MFERLMAVRRLTKGLSSSLLSAMYGIPEILVIHDKYMPEVEYFLNRVSSGLTSNGAKLPRLVVLGVDPERTCTYHATEALKDLASKGFPEGAPITVKFFGIPQEYADVVQENVRSAF